MYIETYAMVWIQVFSNVTSRNSGYLFVVFRNKLTYNVFEETKLTIS